MILNEKEVKNLPVSAPKQRILAKIVGKELSVEEQQLVAGGGCGSNTGQSWPSGDCPR
jgi:hypothetical protein